MRVLAKARRSPLGDQARWASLPRVLVSCLRSLPSGWMVKTSKLPSMRRMNAMTIVAWGPDREVVVFAGERGDGVVFEIHDAEAFPFRAAVR